MSDNKSLSENIDILHGNDYYHSFMKNKCIKITEQLFVIETEFWWILSGIMAEANENIEEHMQNNNLPDLPLKNDSRKQLWELKAIGICDSAKASKDEEAIINFN